MKLYNHANRQHTAKLEPRHTDLLRLATVHLASLSPRTLPIGRKSCRSINRHDVNTDQSQTGKLRWALPKPCISRPLCFAGAVISQLFEPHFGCLLRCAILELDLVAVGLLLTVKDAQECLQLRQ